MAVDNPFPGNPLNDELEKMYIPDCFAEKFAELIVKECATVVASVPPCHGDYRDQIEVGMRDHCAMVILDHFELK